MAEKNKEELIVDSRFNIFEKYVQDKSVVACNIVDYHPVSQLSTNASVIEFNISGEGQAYLDSRNILLKITGSLKETDGRTNANVKDGVCNNFFHALFNQIDVSYNDRQLTESTNNYAYISYIRTLIETTSGQKSSSLQSQLFFPDDSSEIDSNLDTKNTGLAKRNFYSKPGNKLEMTGNLMVDVFGSNTFLLPGVNLRIKLFLNRPEFYIVSSYGQTKAMFVIESATLMVPKLTVDMQLFLSHNEMLKQEPAIYGFHKYVTRIHTIPAQNRNTVIENLFSDKIPSLLVVAMVTSSDFSGNYQTNPYYLRHMKLRKMSLVLNGQNVANTLECDFSSDRSSNATLYKSFTDAVERHFQIKDTGIEMKHFYKGFSLFVFDLSDSSVSGSGELRLTADFADPLSEAVTMILLGRFYAKVYINASRNVSYDMF